MSDQERGSTFRVNARRGTPPTPQEIAARRQREILETQHYILRAAAEVPVGRVIQTLDVQPHRQIDNNSCLLANVVAVRDTIRAKRPDLLPHELTEQQLIALAQREGLIAGGGIFPNRQDVAEFLRRYTGLPFRVNQRAAAGEHMEVAEELVSEVRGGSIAILAYDLGEEHKGAGHFVTISGFRKPTGNTIDWITMDPLYGRTEDVHLAEMADRIVNRPERRGAYYAVEVPPLIPGFRVTGRGPAAPKPPGGFTVTRRTDGR